MRKTSILILLVLACATALLAQAPPKPPDSAARAQHHVQFLTTLLSLTPAQQQQASTIFTNAATSSSSVHDNMRTAHQNLATAVKNNDTAGIDQASTTIGNLTAQMTSTEAKARAAFYQTLTPDQQNKLSQLESERPGRFMHGGPGMGFGPPPGGPGPH